jgi:hypothetical protein
MAFSLGWGYDYDVYDYEADTVYIVLAYANNIFGVSTMLFIGVVDLTSSVLMASLIVLISIR